MADITRLPVKYRRPTKLTGADLYATPTPSDEMVWEMCPYTRDHEETSCHQCPATVEDRNYGSVVLGCRHRAEEACRVVFAMQAKERQPIDSKRDDTAPERIEKDA